MSAIPFFFDLEFPKDATRDTSLFSKWEMKLNSLVDGVMGADASPVEKFSINAPVFKKDKIATIADYRAMPLGDGYNFIDDLTAIDASQKTTDYGV